MQMYLNEEVKNIYLYKMRNTTWQTKRQKGNDIQKKNFETLETQKLGVE